MKSRPISLRLTEREIETLEARAVDVGGTPTGVARHLIRAGLAGGDAAAQGERLIMVEHSECIRHQIESSHDPRAFEEATAISKARRIWIGRRARAVFSAPSRKPRIAL